MNSLKNHILVPMDFSEQALIALSQSFNLARLTKTEITLLYVMDQDTSNPISKLLFKSEASKEAKDKIRAKLDKLAEDTTKESGIKISTLVVKGKVYEQIVKVANRLKATFIIMGTHNKSSIKNKFIGSNTMSVLRDSPCPVITIKGKMHRQGCKNIILPLDLTKETKEKVSKAVELAKLFVSSVRIVSVLDSHDEFKVNKLKRQINQVKKFIEEKGIESTAEFIDGSNIAEGVIAYAKKVKGDLIMIMTQQETDWIDFFIGSKAQHVINLSDIPILSIKPFEKKDMSTFTPY